MSAPSKGIRGLALFLVTPSDTLSTVTKTGTITVPTVTETGIIQFHRNKNRRRPKRELISDSRLPRFRANNFHLRGHAKTPKEKDCWQAI